MNVTIAGYDILEELGANAWGSAFRARQVSLDRPVYITVMDAGAPLESLAKACAAITHPHLVSGIDLGVAEGRTYLVTEWIEGPTVGALVRRGGAMAEERALEIALAAAQGLEHLARKGLVHGNLSPESIVITAGGNPKLVAFGADRESARCDRDYRSPEQKRGAPTDVRSDIYCLGLVLHYQLSAVYPFDDAPLAEVVGSEVVEVPCPLPARSRHFSPEAVDAVDRMTAWRPEDRPRDGGKLVEILEAAVEKIDERVTLRSGRAARPAAGPAARRLKPRRRRRR